MLLNQNNIQAMNALLKRVAPRGNLSRNQEARRLRSNKNGLNEKTPKNWLDGISALANSRIAYYQKNKKKKQLYEDIKKKANEMLRKLKNPTPAAAAASANVGNEFGAPASNSINHNTGARYNHMEKNANFRNIIRKAMEASSSESKSDKWLMYQMYHNKNNFNIDFLGSVGAGAASWKPDRCTNENIISNYDRNSIKLRFTFNSKQSVEALNIILPLLQKFLKTHNVAIYFKLDSRFINEEQQCGKILDFYFTNINFVRPFVDFSHEILVVLAKNNILKDNCLMPFLKYYEIYDKYKTTKNMNNTTKNNKHRSYQQFLREHGMKEGSFMKNMDALKFEDPLLQLDDMHPILTFRDDELHHLLTGVLLNNPKSMTVNDIIKQIKDKDLITVYDLYEHNFELQKGDLSQYYIKIYEEKLRNRKIFLSTVPLVI